MDVIWYICIGAIVGAFFGWLIPRLIKKAYSGTLYGCHSCSRSGRGGLAILFGEAEKSLPKGWVAESDQRGGQHWLCPKCQTKEGEA